MEDIERGWNELKFNMALLAGNVTEKAPHRAGEISAGLRRFLESGSPESDPELVARMVDAQSLRMSWRRLLA